MRYSTFQLQDVCSFIDYRGKTPPKTASGIPLVTAKIVKNGTIQEPQEFIATSYYDEWMRRGIPKKGSVIFTTEAPLGEVARIRTEDKLAFAQRIIILEPNLNRLDADYLFYALQDEVLKCRIGARATGTTVIGIKAAELKKVNIDLPPLLEQKAIAAVLSALDDKIELNNRINQKMEEMAQAIFKSWFVDFEPFQDGEFVESELGPIPKGWKITTLSECCLMVTRGIAPKYSDESNEIIINQKCIRNHEVSLAPARTHTPKAITDKWLKYGDVLVNSTGQGTLGRAAQWFGTQSNITVDSHVSIVRPLNSSLIHFLGQLIMSRENEIENMASGSTGQTELPRERLGNMFVILPDAESLQKYSAIIRPMMEKTITRNDETSSLTNIRDALLPKLMSGEIDVLSIDN